MMKTLQLTSKEKLAIVVFFSVEILSKLLAKFLGVGEQSTGIIFGIITEVPLWVGCISDLALFSLIWIVRKTVKLDKISRIGFVLMISGLLSNLIWRVLFGSFFLWIDLGSIPNFSISEVMILSGAFLAFIGTIWNGIE